MTVPLQRALLVVLALSLLVGVVPAGVALDRWLATALDDRARADLALAPRVLVARAAARGDALMMHAKDLARDDALARAMADDDRNAAERALGHAVTATPTAGALPVVVRAPRQPWTPAPWWSSAADTLLRRTADGAMPVAAIPGPDSAALQIVALAPVVAGGRWLGAAGYAVPVDSQEAAALGALTRSDVVIVGPGRGRAPPVSTLGRAEAAALWTAAQSSPAMGAAREVTADGRRYYVVLGRLRGTAGDRGAGTVIFARRVATELALLPPLRRVLFAALAGLTVVLVAGVLVAQRLVGSVRGLAHAAAATAAGDFAAPLPRSRIREVQQVSHAFAHMRGVLDQRLRELEAANAALAERSTRLAALQGELIQRDRLAATGRLVAQLAHEIRNPVASLRNCLELLRRRVSGDAEAEEFADLAIDELLRMHELAERMLDVHRPGRVDGAATLAAVAHDVATLANLSAGPEVVVDVRPNAATARTRLAPDALKQVLLNLVQNAREAAAPTAPRSPVALVVDAAPDDAVCLTVLDAGPGIAPDVLPRVFDPFFTTKAAVRGVGLGLFVAEGLVRGAGGRLTAGNRPVDGDVPDASGAWFRVELPRAPRDERDGDDDDTEDVTRGDA